MYSNGCSFSADWVPGQGVRIDYAAIIEILIQQLDPQRELAIHNILYWTDTLSDDEIQQSTALLWLAELLTFTQEVMVPFTPRLIPAILPNLAHHVPMIQSYAIRTNKLLLSVIQSLPSPSEPPSRQSTLPSERPASVVARAAPASPSVVPASPPPPRQSTQVPIPTSRESGSVESLTDSAASPALSNITMQKRASLQAQVEGAQPSRLPISLDSQLPVRSPTPRPPSPQSSGSAAAPASVERELPTDAFDYQTTVNALTIQFLSEHEETRVAALKWLIMLHQKVPKKVRYFSSLSSLSCVIIQPRSSRWMTGRFPRYSRLYPTRLRKLSNTICSSSLKSRRHQMIVISRRS